MRVNVVTASIAAVTTIYTSLVALVYAANPGEGKPLTVAAIIPALFLGLALFLVTVYAAMFRKTVTVGPLLPTGMGGQVDETRLVTFMRWTFAGVLARGSVALGLPTRGRKTEPMIRSRSVSSAPAGIASRVR